MWWSAGGDILNHAGDQRYQDYGDDAEEEDDDADHDEADLDDADVDADNECVAD